MRKRCYSLAIFFILCGLGCARHTIQTEIIKPKESDFRNYTTLKITDLANSPAYEIMRKIPDHLAEEIGRKNLFKTVQRIHKMTNTPGDRYTLVLKISVVHFYPGTMEKGIWWGGDIIIRCSVIEKLTNSEIFRCKLSSPLDVYMEKNFERGFKHTSDSIVKEISDLIEKNW